MNDNKTVGKRKQKKIPKKHNNNLPGVGLLGSYVHGDTLTDTPEALSLLVPQLAAQVPVGNNAGMASTWVAADAAVAAVTVPAARATAERMRRWVMLRLITFAKASQCIFRVKSRRFRL